jgi:Sigma-70 region 2
MSHGSQVARESPASRRGQPDDAGLIAESCRVPERFGAVFDRHATAIHGYIARRLGRDAADDLVAETFLVAFRQRASYEPDQPSARPWLYGIATRLVSRRRREEVRFFRAIARSGIDPAADPVAEPVADQECPAGGRPGAAPPLGGRIGGAVHRGPGRAAAGRRWAVLPGSGAGTGRATWNVVLPARQSPPDGPRRTRGREPRR